MSRTSRDEVSEKTQDAILNKLLSRLSEKDVLGEAMEGLTPAQLKAFEDSQERHAARQRKAGKAGW